MVDRASSKGIWGALTGLFGDFVHKDLKTPRTENDVVSSNAKVVLYTLFFLVGFTILLYAITVTLNERRSNNDDTAAGQQPQAAGQQPQAAGQQPQAAGQQPQAAGQQPQAADQELIVIERVLNQAQNESEEARQELNQVEELQQINSVYIAAISGALALGGTLIAQIWGRTKKTGGGNNVV